MTYPDVERRTVARPSGALLEAMDKAYMNVRLGHDMVLKGDWKQAAEYAALARSYTRKADRLRRGLVSA